MTCEPDAAVTLILDGVGGWRARQADGLVGLDRADGVRLAPDRPTGAAHPVPRSIVERALLTSWLATDGQGRWYLAVGTSVLVLDPCDCEMRTLELAGEHPGEIVALTARPGLLAVARCGPRLDTVSIYAVGRHLRSPIHPSGRDARLLGEVAVQAAEAVTFMSGAELLIAHSGGRVSRVGLAGDRRSSFTVRIPGHPVGRATAIGITWSTDRPGWRLIHASALGPSWRVVADVDPSSGRGCALTHDEVRALSVVPGVQALSDDGVAIRACGTTVTIGRDGLPIPSSDLRDDPEPLVNRGSLLTTALDSGVEDCRWHRVVVDVDETPGADWSVDVVTLATLSEAETIADVDWSRVVQSGRSDALLQDQPPGRFLLARLTLTGDGASTARVRRVTLHAGRATSLDHLPAVYRSDDDAVDFTERFLALFDAAIADIDEVIEQAPLLLRADALPDAQLPALARLLGVDVDPSWSTTQLRRLLAHVPSYAEHAGTPAALSTLLGTVFDIAASVEEHGADRPWIGLHRRSPHHAPDCRHGPDRSSQSSGQGLSGFRLYGRARAALILGASILGGAPLRADVDTAAEAGASGAHRCTVHIPPGRHTDDVTARAAIERLIRWAVPAHVTTSIRFARPGMTLDGNLHVGVDTVVLGPPAAVLAGPAERRPRLGRTAIVAAADGPCTPRPIGRPAVVGLDTTAR